MVVVSDTSPVRALAHVDCLRHLGELFDRVLIPPLVAAELESPSPKFSPIAIRSMSLFEVAAPADFSHITSMSEMIHSPEAQALALAIERHVELVIIDDAAGRDVATRLGLSTVGALGVLGRLRKKGLVGELTPMIVRLRDELRFHMSKALIATVLRTVGESPEQGLL